MYIFRNDDVSPSTDFKKIDKIYKAIKQAVPDSEIWSCINILGRKNDKEAVYPDLPLSNLPLEYFYKADAVFKYPTINLHRIVSHGLLHVKHTKLVRQAQEMSIVVSCRALNTDIFVPPFTDYDAITEGICKDNKIKLSRREDGWRSLESEPFDPEHKLWFFHSWRFPTVEAFNDRLLQSAVTT